MAKEALQQQWVDHDFPTPSPLKSAQLHIKLNVVIEEVYQQIRQGNFLKSKKGKVKFKGKLCLGSFHLLLASDLVSWLIKQGKEKADAIKLGSYHLYAPLTSLRSEITGSRLYRRYQTSRKAIQQRFFELVLFCRQRRISVKLQAHKTATAHGQDGRSSES